MDCSTLLQKFGEEFFRWCQEYGYDEVLLSLGRNLQDFLCNLDALHDHLASEYPGMRAPSFHCMRNNDGSLMLHYFSERKGLYDIVIGIVRSVAENLYHTPIEMETIAIFDEDHSQLFAHHTAFSIRFVNKATQLALPSHSRGPEHVVEPAFVHQLLSPAMFDQLFPFHVVFTPAMVIKQCGAALRKVCPSLTATAGQKFDCFFQLIRPPVDFTFGGICDHTDSVFVLQSLPSVIRRTPCEGDDSVGGHRLMLKGQMVYLAEHNVMLFLCSPKVRSVRSLLDHGLYLSDVPVHDAARDLILKHGLHTAESNVFEELEMATDELKVAQKELQEEKRKTDDLLHSILPETVARQLRMGEQVQAEKFSVVTILFSDIKGFTSICSESDPMQVVELLNEMYTLFDSQLAKNNVYKVSAVVCSIEHHPSVWLCAHQSVHPSIYLLIHPFTHSPIRPFVLPSFTPSS